MAKRKTLPKDFEQLVEAGNEQESKMYSKDATSMYTEDTIKKIGDDMELENNDDKFNIEKQIPLMAWHMSKTPPA